MSKLKDPKEIQKEIDNIDEQIDKAVAELRGKKHVLKNELVGLPIEYKKEFQARLNAKLKETNEPEVVTYESLLLYAIYFDQTDIIEFISKYRSWFSFKERVKNADWKDASDSDNEEYKVITNDQSAIKHNIKINWIDEKGKRHLEANIDAIELAIILKRHDYLKSNLKIPGFYYNHYRDLPIRYNDLETWQIISTQINLVADMKDAVKYGAYRITDYILKEFIRLPFLRDQKLMENISTKSDLYISSWIWEAYLQKNPTIMQQLINYAREAKIELAPKEMIDIAKDAASNSDFTSLQICLENFIATHFHEGKIAPTTIGFIKPDIIRAYNEYKKTDEYNLARAKACIHYLSSDAKKLEDIQKLLSLETIIIMNLDGHWGGKIPEIKISLTENTASIFRIWANEAYPQIKIPPNTLVGKPKKLVVLDEDKKQK